MTFAKGGTTKTLPRRSEPATITPMKGTTYGVSSSGVVSSITTGLTTQNVTIQFNGLNWNDDGAICGVSNLKTFLETTVGKGVSLTVTPDYLNPPTNNIWDDLGVSASGAVTMYYDSMSAIHTVGYFWNVTVNLVYVA